MKIIKKKLNKKIKNIGKKLIMLHSLDNYFYLA
jgi:hypothetical protein